jgi:hypothetical protein
MSREYKSQKSSKVGSTVVGNAVKILTISLDHFYYWPLISNMKSGSVCRVSQLSWYH